MQSALTPSADSAARDYYAREKYRSRLCLGGVSLGLAVLGCCAALLPGFQSAAGTLGIALVCAGLLALLCRRQLRCRGRVDSCLLRMRPLLVRQFYPGCGYCLLGSREIQRRLREPSDGIFSGGLGEYGGTLSWPSPRGAVLAHDLTENCPGGSVRDWVVYEYPLPADSPWRQVSYAQIRCLRTPAPEQAGSPLTASALGSHRSPGALERTESWVGNTPLLLRADRPELCRTILTHGAAKPVLRFFREVDCRRHILCFCRGSLFVFARDSRLDQHWSRREGLCPEEIRRNTAAVCRILPLIPPLAG